MGKLSYEEYRAKRPIILQEFAKLSYLVGEENRLLDGLYVDISAAYRIQKTFRDIEFALNALDRLIYNLCPSVKANLDPKDMAKECNEFTCDQKILDDLKPQDFSKIVSKIVRSPEFIISENFENFLEDKSFAVFFLFYDFQNRMHEISCYFDTIYRIRKKAEEEHKKGAST